MPVDVACQCGARFRAKDHLAGKRVPCPRCGKPLAITAQTEPQLAPIARSAFDHPVSPSQLPSTANDALRAALAEQPLPEPPPHRGKFGYELAKGMPTRIVVLAAVLAVGSLLLSVPMSFIAFVEMGRAVKSDEWRETTCEITKSDLKRRGIRSVRYDLELAYAYSVDGHQYSSSRISVSGDHGFDPRSLARKYKVGTQHAVFYNPRQPGEAVLVQGFSRSNVGWFAIAIAFCLAGFVATPILACTLLNRFT